MDSLGIFDKNGKIKNEKIKERIEELHMLSPHELELEIIRNTTPEMRYKGDIPFETWQQQARAKLLKLMGFNFKKSELDFSIEYKKVFDDFTEIRFKFQSEENYYVPCHLLIPNLQKKLYNVVICLQGHSTGMHISLGRAKFDRDEETIKGGDRDFAIRAVKEGYAALCLEQRNFGECGGTAKGPDCVKAAMAAILIGRTVIGERVWDIMRAIDVIEKYFPELDAENIACMGNSGGGTSTFYAACADERIKYAMPSCAFCEYEDSIAPIHHCSCNFIPNIRKYFEMGDLAGLIAPRVFVAVAGKEDLIFPKHGVEKAFAKAKKLYTYANAEDKCSLVLGDEGHRFYADLGWAEFNRLKNIK